MGWCLGRRRDGAWQFVGAFLSSDDTSVVVAVVTGGVFWVG